MKRAYNFISAGISPIVLAAIAVIGIVHGVLIGALPPLGDDLVYASYHLYHDGSLLYYPKWAASHVLGVNGRLPDIISPLMLYFLPMWALKATNALMVTIWLWSMLKLMKFRSSQAVAPMCALCLVVFGYTWWDSTAMAIVMLNYVWSIAFVTLWLVMYTSEINNRGGRICLYLLSLCAGMSHEAAAIPLTCALAAYFVITRSWASTPRYKRCAVICFAAANLCFLPGILLRIGTGMPDDYWYMLVLRSAYFVVALIVAVGLMLVMRRTEMMRLLHTPFLIFSMASIFSAGVVMAGGIVGRSGWFAQTYALIALFILYNSFTKSAKPRPGIIVRRMCACALLALITAHYIYLCIWQHRLGREVREVVALYKESTDGVVCYDFTRPDEVPWYLLGKTCGVPRETDFFVLYTLRNIEGDSVKVLTVLPIQAADYHGDSIMWLRSHRDFLSPKLPDNASDTLEGGFGRRMLTIGATKYTVIPYPAGQSTYYYVTPKLPDPTDSRFMP